MGRGEIPYFVLLEYLKSTEYLINPLNNFLGAFLGLLHSLGQVNPTHNVITWFLYLCKNCINAWSFMKPPPAVQAELLARHHHAPHPPVGLAPAAWNMEENINKIFLLRYFHYDRLIDTLIFQLAVTPNASLSAIYIHLPTAGGILGPQVLSGLVLLSSEISFSRQLLRNIPGPERRGRTSKLKLKAQGLQRTPKAKDMGNQTQA